MKCVVFHECHISISGCVFKYLIFHLIDFGCHFAIFQRLNMCLNMRIFFIFEISSSKNFTNSNSSCLVPMGSTCYPHLISTMNFLSKTYSKHAAFLARYYFRNRFKFTEVVIFQSRVATRRAIKLLSHLNWIVIQFPCINENHVHPIKLTYQVIRCVSKK